MGDRVLSSNIRGKKLEVEEHRRNVQLPKNKSSVTACNDSLNSKTLNVKSVSAMCDKCVMIDKHDLCVLNNVAKPLKKTVASESNKKPRNNVRKLNEHFVKIYKWSYIKFTPSGYMWKPKSPTGNVNPNLIEIVLFIVESGCSKHMTRNLKLLINFVEKFLGTVKFGNDQIAPILGYGDLIHLAHFLRSKDETPKVLIDFLRLVQRGLQAQVRVVRTDKGTEFLNQTLHAYFAAEGIQHQTSVARTPEQNGVVERRNRTLVEVARKMLSAAKVPLFFWAEAIATACFTQNHSLSRAYIVFNKRTRVTMESIHVNFNELPDMASVQNSFDPAPTRQSMALAHNSSDPTPTCLTMASVQISSDPAPECQTMALEHNSLSPGRKCQENVSHGDKTGT
nr:putative ribonuclease H-like domain-containing protein [Tanacetum cinerariifolium]